MSRLHAIDRRSPSRLRLNPRSRSRRARRMRFDVLESRTLLSDFMVTTTADSGPGSLRQAILDSNAAPGQNTIGFNIGNGGAQTIMPASALPTITNPVVIDGTTQPGYSGTPIIVIDGSDAGDTDGLDITAGNSTVRGLVINQFSEAGLELQTNGGDVVQDSFFGTDVLGESPEPDNIGIEIDAGSTGNLIGTSGTGVNDASERNLISGNLFAGVLITGQGTTGNAIAGNLIGTDITGTLALDNGTQPVTDPSGQVVGGGVLIGGGAEDNRVGTDGRSVDDTGERNVIAGSGYDAIDIYGTGTDGNIVSGNFIGTDITGTHPLGVAQNGVSIVEGASFNWVGISPNGGNAADEANVISGNPANGVVITTNANSNVVAGNRIGTDVTGTVALGNCSAKLNPSDGVLIYAASDNTIGGTATGWGNVISGNESGGIGIGGSSFSNDVVGNVVGLGSGAAGNAIPNDADGVTIFGGASDNTVGGTTASARNIISGNLGSGVDLQESASGNVVSGNLIGTDGSGTVARPNQGNGVWIWDGASANTVGGTTAAAGNLISGNQSTAGVYINGTGTTGNVVAANFIGTNISATAAIGNLNPGVVIGGGAASNTIGGTVAGSRNIISGNHADGVDLDGSGTSHNVVEGNLIGTDITGTAPVPNQLDGVQISGGATSNTVGGTIVRAANVISGNSAEGVVIVGQGTSDNVVLGNLIGTDGTGKSAVANAGGGILLYGGASANIIGGTVAGARNLISGNGSTLETIGYAGVAISGTGTTRNVVEGNFIGTDVTGSRALGNSGDGISVYGGASANTIGGNGTGSGNLISGNRFSGIHISGAGTVGNLVSGDLIGTGITGKLPVGNTLDGVRIDSGASGNTIGGSFARAGNVIAFNAANGVRVGLDVLDAALDNAILDNSIFSNSVLGIDIDDSAPRRAPVLSAATISRSKTTMAGTLSGTDDTVFRVEFFSNPARTSEGKTYLGFIQVTTNRKGSASFSFSSSSLAVGLMVTATAADPSGNTSEFSAAVTVRNRHRSGQKTGADRKERTEDIHSSGQKTSALPPVPRLS